MSSKEVYQQKIEVQLEIWKAELEVLKLKSKLASADVKADLDAQIHKLEAKLPAAKAKIQELTQSTGEAWEVIKDGTETMWDNLKQTLSEAKSKFDK